MPCDLPARVVNIETGDSMSNVPGADGDKVVCPACKAENIEMTNRERKYECQNCETVFEPSGRQSIE
jgi:rubredoxin